MTHAHISETFPKINTAATAITGPTIWRYFKFSLLQFFKNNLIDDTIERDQGEVKEEEEDLGSDLDDFIVEDSQSQELVSDVNSINNHEITTDDFSLADEVFFRLLTTHT